MRRSFAAGAVASGWLGLMWCASAIALPECDDDNGGLQLPAGFCALVVADDLGRARHLEVSDNGDVYVALRGGDDGGVVGLRDEDGDGRADTIARFGDYPGSGIGVHGDYLYFGSDTTIVRYPLDGKSLLPTGKPEVVVDGFPEQSQHGVKTLTFDAAGGMYVNVGAPSNACQKRMRQVGSPGLDPCPQLERAGGIWRFVADLARQRQADGERYASGIRNAVALTWNREVGRLYVVQHGRDQLSELWPAHFDQRDRAELPAEELLAVGKGDDFGWPYCYYNHLVARKLLSPEYGGDGTTVGRCSAVKAPLYGFPAHWAPNAIRFYHAEQFPNRFAGGAFIAFHGSWNRQPYAQAGYRVVFLPFDGKRVGKPVDFATGFAGQGPIKAPSDARYRPTGLAVGADGSLYIADSVKGRIWRVLYRG